MKNKHKILMAVFNEIDCDARVIRAAETLGNDYEVYVLAIDSGLNYNNRYFKSYLINIKNKSFKKKLIIFWLKFITISKNIKPDIIYAHDFYLCFPGYIVAKLNNSKYIYDSHELLIDIKNYKIKFWVFLEKIIINKCDLVIAANNFRASIMKKYYKLKNKPLVIRNITKNINNTFVKKDIYKKYSILNNSKIKLVYQGSMDLKRGIHLLLDLIFKLDDRFVLVLIGDRVDYEKIKDLILLKSLKEKVILLGRVPQSLLINVLSVCHIGLVIYPFTGLNNIYCASNKIYDYTHGLLPVLSTNQIPLKKIMEEYHIGYTYKKDDLIEDISNKVNDIINNYDYFQDNVKRFMIENSWENGESQKLINTVGLLTRRAEYPRHAHG